MPSLADFDAFSFDCYGTLIDWEAGILTALRRWLAGRRPELDDGTLLAAHARLEPEVQAADPGALYPVVLGRVLAGIGEEVGVPVTPADGEAFGASVGDWPAFADSPEALARLARHGRLIILSNIDRASFARSNARLGVAFDVILTAQDIGAYKPDARNFQALLAAAASLGIAQDRLLHVAQSLYHDHVPAQAIGLRTAWIDRRSGRSGTGATPMPAVEVHPDWTFPTLAALADAVDSAATGRAGPAAAAGSERETDR